MEYNLGESLASLLKAVIISVMPSKKARIMSVSSASVINHVLFLIAMEAEAAPLLAYLKLEEIKVEVGTAPTRMYTGRYVNYTHSSVY